MSDLELALRYSPYIMFDKAEPFAVNGIGYSVFCRPGASRSFRRELYPEPVGAAFVIEYAVYFDYDIQHMYDLEHIWIYVDSGGGICDAEASFHGFYLKSMSLGKEIVKDRTHLQIYCQPGKHAFMPDGNLFRLLPDWYLCCNLLAGSEGLLVMDLFKEHYSTDHHRQKQVEQYIKKKYAFEPTLQFEYRPLDNSLFSTWEELRSLIPVRIKKELSRID